MLKTQSIIFHHMNELQKKLILYTQIKEKILAETFINHSKKHKKLQQMVLHKYAMEEFKRLGEEKLTIDQCNPECIFCHPELLQAA